MEDQFSKEKPLEVPAIEEAEAADNQVADKSKIIDEEVVIKQDIEALEESNKKVGNDNMNDEANISMFAMEVRLGKESFMKNFCEIIRCPVNNLLKFLDFYFLLSCNYNTSVHIYSHHLLG